MNWDEIREKCPKLYKNPLTFECGKGWTNILHDLSLKIEEILNKDTENEMYAIQVKEKYGSLSFYMSMATNEINDLINEADILSLSICEACGANGRLRGLKENKWLEVRCDKCYGGEIK